ncbi:MAG: hypothetical protein M0R17_07195 [Candidatus Omnitrophica bacterium]|jgi:hypothetical protein|nr:hypothetical protein [Candidatus Omnitrophota bacterium]
MTDDVKISGLGLTTELTPIQTKAVIEVWFAKLHFDSRFSTDIPLVKFLSLYNHITGEKIDINVFYKRLANVKKRKLI